MTDEEVEEKVGELGICGCGSPDSVYEWLLSVLKGLDTPPGEDKAQLPVTTPQEWFIVYMLDKLNLTEHGTSVSWSWLTDYGREMIPMLERYLTIQEK